MNTASPERARTLALVAAFLGWMFDGFEIGLFPVIARPALQNLLGAGSEGNVGLWMGWITAAFLVGAALGGGIFGWLGDRVGRIRAMSISILTYSLCSGLGYFADSPWQLGLFRFLAALGMGGEWALGVALVMETWPEKHRPWLAGAIGAAANLGMVLVGFVAQLVKVTPGNWRSMFLIGATPALLTLVIRLFVPESDRWRKAVAVRTARPFQELMQTPWLGRALIGIALASIALIGTWGSVQWLPLWADQITGGTNPSAKTQTQMMSSFGAVVGSLIAPMIGGAIPRRVGFVGLCTLSAVVCGVLFRQVNTFDSNFLAGAFLAGAATASFYGWFPLYFPELFPTRIRATGQGLCFNTGRIVAALGAILSGRLVKHFDGQYAKVAAVITLVYLLGWVVVWFMPETHRKQLPE